MDEASTFRNVYRPVTYVLMHLHGREDKILIDVEVHCLITVEFGITVDEMAPCSCKSDKRVECPAKSIDKMGTNWSIFCLNTVPAWRPLLTVRVSATPMTALEWGPKWRISDWKLTNITVSGVIHGNGEVLHVNQEPTPREICSLYQPMNISGREYWRFWRGAVVFITSTPWSKFVSVLSLEMKQPYSGWPGRMLYQRSSMLYQAQHTFLHHFQESFGLWKVCSDIQIVVY